MKRLLLASLSSTAAVCVCISDGGNIPTRIRHPRNKVEENVQESRREKRRWRNNFSFFFKFLVSFCLQRTAACSQPTTDYFTRSLLFLYSVVSLSLLFLICFIVAIKPASSVFFSSPLPPSPIILIPYSTFLVLSFSFWCSFFFLSFFLALSLFIYLYPIVLPSIIRFNSVQSPFRSPFSFHISFHPSHHVLLLSSWSSWSSTLFYCRCFPFFYFILLVMIGDGERNSEKTCN